MSFKVLLILSMLASTCLCYEYTGRFFSYENHTCIRDCTQSSRPMVCEYDFTLEDYTTLSRYCYNCRKNNQTDCYREGCVTADGTARTVMVINRMLPGPSIQVCQGDTIVVNLHNKLRSERVTSIHWHGIKQKGSADMDGVGLITQYPIGPHSSFTYKFKANDPGTHVSFFSSLDFLFD